MKTPLNGTWHDKYTLARTGAQKFADAIAVFTGSWTFLVLHAIWFFFWIYYNVEPFPFGLLTMIVSLEAIFLSTIILISQNRQSQRDRIQASADYETNLEAKKEIEHIMMRLDAIEENKLDKILKILEERK